MGRLLKVFLPFLIPGLIIVIAKEEIPWDRFNVFWLMAFVFHIPLILFFIFAIIEEIMDSMEKKDEKGSDANKLGAGGVAPKNPHSTVCPS